MKTLLFTIPVAHDKSVISEQFNLPFFYPYLHRHKEAQLTWIQKGEGTLVAGNNMHSFKAGEIYLLGADLPHVFKSNPEYFGAESDKNISAVSIFFNPNGKLSSLFELPELRSFKNFIQRSKQGFKLPDDYLKPMSDLMLRVDTASGSEKVFDFFNLLNFLNNIKDQLTVLSSSEKVINVNIDEGARINNIYNFIIQHYNKAITLEDVSQAAYMTPQAFCRYFKKHTGHTYISFLNEVRINEACKRLTANKFESISAVAYNCGFNTITNFNRVFKCVKGSSPKGYLDSYQKNVNVAQ
ncbi:AraC family transcriptional regulator [Mucilaginibacter sp.]|uniref:AraC family transcriptional regulator n=1 Tax=Mucilaginibacter sp. TaxID=1882438 RepID=UPI00284CA3C8|nr:AraC family transcriptional regulator [Mucilaginibacter sp.]MDR3697872.1 AraC family transcriptional regulator [Mucilaginibacter sp.]